MAHDHDSRLSRRSFALVAATVPVTAACTKKRPASEEGAAVVTPLAAIAQPTLIRVASVPTAVEGNLLPTLIRTFEATSHFRVELVSSPDVYELARAGRVDLVVSHYGHKHAEEFVMGGFGEWPRTLFSNQMALLGPPSDPAKIRGLTDAGEAFKRIAAAKAPFIVNHIDGVRYLTEILWNAAGQPARGDWYIDSERAKVDAVTLASEKRGYTLWGLTPFNRTAANEHPPVLEPLVTADPLLQRMLVSILVKPARIAGVNDTGARALEAFLLAPATQARIREVRYPGGADIAWVPGGRHNRSAILPKG